MPIEIEIGQPPHDRLARDRDPGERAGGVVGERAGGAGSLCDIGSVVVREKEGAARGEPHDLLHRRPASPHRFSREARRRRRAEVRTHRRRVGPFEHAAKRRGERFLGRAGRRENARLTTASARRSGSKNAPFVMRAPRSQPIDDDLDARSGSDRSVGTHASPMACLTAALRRALVTRPANPRSRSARLRPGGRPPAS